jgi:hypothetical protein
MPCEACDAYSRRVLGKKATLRNKNRERFEMSIGYVLWAVAQEYKRIYRQHRKYGVWGHAITDLYFEGLDVQKNGNVTLLVGS